MKLLSAAAVAVLVAAPAAATTLRVTVTHDNETPLFITPLYTAFHGAEFDAFDLGGEASGGLELIAETGGATLIAAERSALDSDSVGGVLAAGAGPGPIFSDSVGPGVGNPLAQSASGTFEVDGASNQFFTFLSMVLPSNDTFIGSDDAIRVFDDNGNFLGTNGLLTVNVTGNNIYDAGTEVNDASADGGAAFAFGADINAGAEEGGFVTQSAENTLAAFANIGLAPPPDPLNNIGNLGGLTGPIDFFSNRADFAFLTITIEEVSEVPLPAGAVLLLSALGMGGIASRRKTKKA